jgi:hypothetical protein
MKGPPKAFVSLHDVMPETLERVRELIAFTNSHNVPPITLLVVPGRQWQKAHIAQLREWARQGHPLAAHGWMHSTQPRSLYHRLHASLISRNVAEHLALPSDGILHLMERSYAWFGRHGLPEPELYVPPAWALGSCSRTALRSLAVQYIESTRGFLHIPTGRYAHRPLIGFEADTPARAFALRLWNTAQVLAARKFRWPLRISLHPNDLHLLLAPSLKQIFNRDWRYVSSPSEA